LTVSPGAKPVIRRMPVGLWPGMATDNPDPSI
jgi:hypothetical protein